MTRTREDDGAGRRGDEAAERYLDLWERNLSDLARRGPPPAAVPAPGPATG